MKKIKPYFLAYIKNGKMELHDPDRFKKYVTKIQNKSGETKVKITIDKYRNTRSVNQNNYYWGVIIPILGEWSGIDEYEYVEQIHIPLKKLFLGHTRKEVPINATLFGKSFETPYTTILSEIMSTTKLNTKEFTEYIDKIRRWAKIEHNVNIPAPNEIDYDDRDYVPPFATV